jgi:type I restriction enzyme M protein
MINSINLLENNINNSKIILKIEDNKNILDYSTIVNKKFEFNNKNQGYLGELGRVYFIQSLLNIGLNKKSIIIEQNTDIGSGNNKKRADLFLKTKEIVTDKECYILVEIKTSINKLSNKQLNKFFKNQLYNIATSLRNNPDFPYYPCFLMLVTIEIIDNKIYLNKYLTSFEAIDPKNIDVSFYKTDFKIEENDIYINTTPLTYNDLQEFKKAEKFRYLLNQELHQKLRNSGFVGEEAFNIIFQLLLAKLYEEMEILSQKEFKKILDFQILPKDLLNKKSLRNRINKLYQEARIYFFKEDAKEVTSKYNIKKDLKDDVLIELVKIMQVYKFKNTKKLKDDVLGDVFEEFIHQTYKQSKGMFFTHPNITSFCVKAVGFNKDEIREKSKTNPLYICDPSCGSGSFLIEALKELYKNEDYFNIKKEAEKNFYGIDVSSKAVEITKVNMALNGDGSAKIYNYDTLSKLDNLKSIFKFLENNKNGEIDYILSNPPFSLTGLDKENLRHFKVNEYLSDNKQSEFYFIERWWELLVEQGIIAVVLPLSVIENSNNKEALKLINSFFEFYSILYLPEYAFTPFANQKTMLLFAKKRKKEETERLINLMKKDEKEFLNSIEKEIFFKEIRNIGYKRDKKQQTIRTIHLDENDLNEELEETIYNLLYFDKKPNENMKSLLSILKFFTSKNSNNSIFNKFEITNIGSKPSDNKNYLIVETGDIQKRTSLILPKSIDDLSEGKKINLNNKKNKLIQLLPTDVIISPVRIYQKKFAIVTPNATKNFLFSKDFVILRNKNILYKNDATLTSYKIENDKVILKYIDKNKKEIKFSYNLENLYNNYFNDSLKLLNSFYDKENEEKLFFSSITGKSGYPKLSKNLFKKSNITFSINNNIIDIMTIEKYNSLYESFSKILIN